MVNLFAAKLSVFLYVYFFRNAALHLCVCYGCFVHEASNERPSWHFMVGNERISCISDFDGLLFYGFMVRRWIHCLSSLSHKHKSDNLQKLPASTLVRKVVEMEHFLRFRLGMRLLVTCQKRVLEPILLWNWFLMMTVLE